MFIITVLNYFHYYYVSPLYTERETYSFTSHRSFLSHISLVSVRSVLSVYHAGNQTRDVDPMSGYCWPTVYISPVLGYRVVFDATLHVGQRHRPQGQHSPCFCSKHRGGITASMK